MKTLAYFIRHAQSTYTLDERERPLSEAGFEAALQVAHQLQGEGIEVIISSPYRRAVQTVEPLAQQLALPVSLNEAFRERHICQHPVDDFFEAMQRLWSDYSFAFEGGESNFVAQKRGVVAFREILNTYRGKRIAIGAHGNIMTLTMNHFDDRFNHSFWQQLTMPDIYRLTFQDNTYLGATRLWRAP